MADWTLSYYQEQVGMDAQNKVEITDRDGWRKEFPLQKPLIHIGSDPRNDLVLGASRGTGVAPRHLQLIYVPGEQPGYRGINLGDQDIIVGDLGNSSVAPRSAVQIVDGDRLRLGDFTLVFRLSGESGEVMLAAGTRVAGTGVQREDHLAAVGNRGSSAAIGLTLALSGSTLVPDRPLEGVVTVHNLGKKPGVQFRLDVENLESDCYQIGPGPILFPNASKEVLLRLYHPKNSALPAGAREIGIRATAPDAYPGESAAVTQDIQVLPFYSHRLRVVSTD
jgi:hypothetical protein